MIVIHNACTHISTYLFITTTTNYILTIHSFLISFFISLSFFQSLFLSFLFFLSICFTLSFFLSLTLYLVLSLFHALGWLCIHMALFDFLPVRRKHCSSTLCKRLNHRTLRVLIPIRVDRLGE